MNTNLTALHTEVMDENKKEKISLIEDNFKVMRLLCGFGFTDYNRIILDPGELFDELYEMSIIQLSCVLAYNSATASLKARELAGFATDEQPIKRNNY